MSYLIRPQNEKKRYISSDLKRRVFLMLGLLGNLGALFYLKYFDFFISNLNQLFGMDFRLLYLVLPLGISFFTFQQVSYLIDCYQGKVPQYSFFEYALFVTFFPRLIAGIDSDEHQLVIGSSYMEAVVSTINTGKPIIALGHHGLEFLQDNERRTCEYYFDQHNIRLYLCGHTHCARFGKFGEFGRQVKGSDGIKYIWKKKGYEGKIFTSFGDTAQSGCGMLSSSVDGMEEPGVNTKEQFNQSVELLKEAKKYMEEKL